MKLLLVERFYECVVSKENSIIGNNTVIRLDYIISEISLMRNHGGGAVIDAMWEFSAIAESKKPFYERIRKFVIMRRWTIWYKFHKECFIKSLLIKVEFFEKSL